MFIQLFPYLEMIHLLAAEGSTTCMVSLVIITIGHETGTLEWQLKP